MWIVVTEPIIFCNKKLLWIVRCGRVKPYARYIAA